MRMLVLFPSVPTPTLKTTVLSRLASPIFLKISSNPSLMSPTISLIPLKISSKSPRALRRWAASGATDAVPKSRSKVPEISLQLAGEALRRVVNVPSTLSIPVILRNS